MVFFKKKEVVGLDIGSHSIKLVQLNETGKGMELINFGVMPLQTEAVVGGAIMDANIIVEAIQNLIEVQKVKTKDVVTSVSGTSVIIKKVKLPFMTEEELAESIEWEAEQYIPFDISDVNIDFQILESAELLEEKGSDQMEVLIVAIKREKIDDYTNLILEAGMNPVIVDVDAFAIENSYELNYDIKKRDSGLSRYRRCSHEHQYFKRRYYYLYQRYLFRRKPLYREYSERIGNQQGRC